MTSQPHYSRPLHNKNCNLIFINIETKKITHWALRANKSELGSCRAQKCWLGLVAIMIITGS
jgi:hypothetical protein